MAIYHRTELKDRYGHVTRSRATTLHNFANIIFIKAYSQQQALHTIEELLNTQILHCLQSSLTSASLASLSLSGSSATPLHQVLICGTHILPQLCQFWNTLRAELANEGPYKASIGSMRLRLQEL